MVDATRDPLPDYYKRDPSNISLSHLICGLLRQESISTLRFDLQLTEATTVVVSCRRRRRQEGRQRGEGGGGDPPDGAAAEDPPPLVEGILRLGEVLGGGDRRVLQVGERPRLAGEEVGDASPARTRIDRQRTNNALLRTEQVAVVARDAALT
jgi:hypothetical protein